MTCGRGQLDVQKKNNIVILDDNRGAEVGGGRDEVGWSGGMRDNE